MLEQIARVIEDFLIGYQREPGRYAEESDLRRELFSALFRHCERLGFRYEMAKKTLGIEYDAGQTKVTLTPVRTEYPAASPFHIAVLDIGGEAANRSPEASERFGLYWEQPVFVGINVHYCSSGQDLAKYYRKLDKDLVAFQKFADDNGNEADFCGLTLLLAEGDAAAASHIQQGLDALHPGGQAWIVAENGEFLYN